MTWNPLLDGAQRDAAVATARDIGAALVDPPPCAVIEDEPERAARVTNAALATGRAGMALSLGYLSLADPDHPQYATTARRLAADAARAMSAEVMTPSLYGGFCGIAWALKKLSDWKLIDIANESFAVIDKGLAQYLQHNGAPEPFELVYGLAGYLVYALARLPHPDATRAIERALQIFEETAEQTHDGVTWFVPASRLRSTTLERAPQGCYNLGVAHGSPGVIGILAEMFALGIEQARTRRLLERSVEWLLAQELPGGNFASLIGPGIAPKEARMSWCYGSPGIPLVLMRAARALDREDWYETALRLATTAASKPVEQAGVEDPPFCHGAAGLVHQFNRLYQETGKALFADAARMWFDRLLDYRVEGHGVAGFAARTRPDAKRYPEPGFLYGAAGIGAVLGAAISNVDPSWDAMFLLSDAGAA